MSIGARAWVGAGGWGMGVNGSRDVCVGEEAIRGQVGWVIQLGLVVRSGVTFVLVLDTGCSFYFAPNDGIGCVFAPLEDKQGLNWLVGGYLWQKKNW